MCAGSPGEGVLHEVDDAVGDPLSGLLELLLAPVLDALLRGEEHHRRLLEPDGGPGRSKGGGQKKNTAR